MIIFIQPSIVSQREIIPMERGKQTVGAGVSIPRESSSSSVLFILLDSCSSHKVASDILQSMVISSCLTSDSLALYVRNAKQILLVQTFWQKWKRCQIPKDHALLFHHAKRSHRFHLHCISFKNGPTLSNPKLPFFKNVPLEYFKVSLHQRIDH